jgi:hypothetical protein
MQLLTNSVVRLKPTLWRSIDGSIMPGLPSVDTKASDMAGAISLVPVPHQARDIVRQATLPL